MEIEFEDKLQLIEVKWSECEMASCSKFAFFDWFIKYHADEIKCSMLRSVRHAAGLGDPPSEYLNNDSNSAVKQYLEF